METPTLFKIKSDKYLEFDKKIQKEIEEKYLPIIADYDFKKALDEFTTIIYPDNFFAVVVHHSDYYDVKDNILDKKFVYDQKYIIAVGIQLAKFISSNEKYGMNVKYNRCEVAHNGGCFKDYVFFFKILETKDFYVSNETEEQTTSASLG